MMYQIKRVDAFELIVKTQEAGNHNVANEMIQIVSRALIQSKKSNLISDFIEITDERALRLFKDIINASDE